MRLLASVRPAGRAVLNSIGATRNSMARRQAPARLIYWRPPSGAGNFGDELSPQIVGFMLAQRGLTVKSVPSRRVLAIGSVMHLAGDGDVVWGSGVNWKLDPNVHRFKTLDVRAVRGPLTRDFLLSRGIDCPPVYGDPGLLVSKIFPAAVDDVRVDHVVVPNLNDMKLFADEPNLVSPYEPVRDVLDKIARAGLVVASSLHGIIAAESYGVPARAILPAGHAESVGKYQDYYLGTGRRDVEVARSLGEAFEMGGAPLPVIDTAALEAAFPWDLYRAGVG